MKPQNYPIKRALESFFMAHIPIFLHNSECNVLIRWPYMKSYNASLPIAPIILACISWSLCPVYHVWVEDIKLVSSHNLWRWIFMIVVSPVIFVPFISSVKSIDILRLSRLVLVTPPFYLHVNPGSLQRQSQLLHHLPS
ncbi:hypothetical protein Peur_002074 [Populus x canadensis]